MSSNKRIIVEYYASLRETRGLGHEEITTSARTPRELYETLSESYRFGLAPEQLRVAVNDEFASWSRELRDADKIVFMQPVSGG